MLSFQDFKQSQKEHYKVVKRNLITRLRCSNKIINKHHKYQRISKVFLSRKNDANYNTQVSKIKIVKK